MGTHHEDEIVGRLRSLGSAPVDPTLAEAHTSYLVTPPVVARTRMRPLLAGALVAGVVLGGTGLAAAVPGSLPRQAGSVARSALVAVNLAKEKPSAADKAAAKAAKAARVARAKVGRFTQGCTTGTPPVPFTGNHGQYVKAHPDDPATLDVNERQVAAQSDCGKPLTSLEDRDDTAGTEKAERAEKAAKPEKPEKPAKPAKPAGAEDDDDEGEDRPARPADAGPPTSGSPGKSGEEHPPATAGEVEGAERPGSTAGSTTTTTTAG